MAKQTNKLLEMGMEEILQKIPEALIICDANYKVTFINDAFIRLFEEPKSKIIGQNFQNLVKNTSKIDCHICKGTQTKYLPVEDYSHQAILLKCCGNEIPIRISHNVVQAGEYYISLITPMRDLACLDQAQIDFVSTVSHELRTPMTSIKGFADTLLNAGDQLSKEQQTRFITIIKDQADRLTRLVENLLTVSRLETKRHKSVYRALDLKSHIDRVIMTLKSKYPNNNFTADIAENLPPVWADQDKLEQVLTNLIDNAAKYSGENKPVRVEAMNLPDDPDKMQVRIIDEGVGIPEQYLPKIFNKFSRIDNPLTRQVQGTGLGLYITQALVKSMGGTINVSSPGADKGSCFEMILLVATQERLAQQGLAES